MKLNWTRCPCGHHSCHDWHITNFGKFVQGSGFNDYEKATLDHAFAAEEELVAYKQLYEQMKAELAEAIAEANKARDMASRERDRRIADLNEPGKYKAP